MVLPQNRFDANLAMLLACPNCATTYEIKASVIGENGRSLRCARCHVVWFATRSQELVGGVQPAANEGAPAASSTFTTATAPGNFGAAPSTQSAAQEYSTDFQPDDSNARVDSPPLAPAANPALSVEGEDIESFARRHSKNSSKRAAGLRNQVGAPAIIAILGVVFAALIAWRVTIVQHAPQMASFYASIGLPVNLRQLAFSEVKTIKEIRDGVPTLLVEGTITSMSKFSVEVPRLRFGLRNRNGQEIYSWTALPEHTILAPGDTLPFRSRLASPPSEGHDVVVRFFNRRDATEGAR